MLCPRIRVFAAIVLFICAPMWLVTCLVAQEQPVEPTLDELIAKLESDNPNDKMHAAAELVDQADEIDKFIAPLAELFGERDELIQRAATRVFERLGETAVPSIRPFLEATDNEKFRRGCSMVNAIGDPACEYRELLVNTLANNDDPQFRVAAIYALTGFSNGAPEAIEYLTPDFNNQENFNFSVFACRLVIKTGPAAKAAIPELEKLLKNGNVSQRSYAAWAMGAIGQTDEFDTLKMLNEMLNRFTVFERERALYGIGLMGEEAISLADRVEEIMTKPGTNLEARAAFVLWQITGENQPSVDRLIELSKQPFFDLSAIQILGEMGPAAAPAADYLATRTTAEDEAIREAAADALGAMGAKALDQKQALFKLLEDEDPLVRLAADVALEKITEDAGQQ